MTEGHAVMSSGARKFSSVAHTAFIGNREASENGGQWIDSVDPATGKTITQIADTPAALVDQAVRTAHEAFLGPWGSMPPMARERVLHRLADLIEANADELAQYDALESGKPVTYVRAIDVSLAIEQFRYYAGWPSKIEGATLPVETGPSHVYTRRVPLGVVAAITPWNFPLCQAAIKLAPALAAGNTVVLKPSELTSLSALRLAELALEAGLPEGTLNVVTGTGATTGEALVTHPLVEKISFTGSEAVGRRLAQRAGRDLKHLSLELGGKNPHLIFRDADLEKAIAAAATTAFFYTGQVCFAGSRLLVERSVLDEVVAGLESHARSLVLGPGLDPRSTVGPLSSAKQRDKVEGYVRGALEAGARVAFGGGRPADLPDGYFHEPTAIVGAKDDDAVVTEEIFGPVVTVQPFDSVEEAVERAGRTSYGLTAGVWTRDLSKAHGVSSRLPAGTTWVNTYGDFSAVAPWGGIRNSGLGRDCGAEGLDKFLQTRTTWMSLA
ncbi:aldehyde dehydrogenase family protein [Streptomyces shenzhenensis]|uniref:aldehyde dehydrogenase family protein n=1 Tax=Streptomyces shenzhenensis TaxID=943815 RepID=UPI00380A259A